MANPFPGIDPYIEDQGLWPDFHTSFLVACRRALLRGLPRHYDARIEERLTVVTLAGEETAYRADVIVTARRSETSSPLNPGPTSAGPATATIPFPTLAEESVIERWIEVRRQPDRALVAVIELLSPSNKVVPGRLEYLRRREEFVRQAIHIVEFDFLIRGRRLPMKSPLPPGDAFALVGRADRRPDCEICAWSIRQPLPNVTIPLDAPDPDVALDLAAVYAAAHEEGEYDRTIDNLRPLALPLAPDDLAWAESLARESPGR